MVTDVDIFPAFGYAREPHTTTILQQEIGHDSLRSKVVTFHSVHEKLQLDVTVDGSQNKPQCCPSIAFRKVRKEHMLGEGVTAHVVLTEGQGISFVLRADSDNHVTENITASVVDSQQNDTQMFWFNWLSKSKYRGAWREIVSRSLLILKMLTYEPTGAIVAAPTFSIPEDIGGVR